MSSAPRPQSGASGINDRGAHLAPQVALEGDVLDHVVVEERALDRDRLRFVLGLAAVLWGVFSVTYVPIALSIDPRPLWHFLLPHALGGLAIVGALSHVRRAEPTALREGLALAVGFGVPALCLVVVSSMFRGLVSPFGHGTLVVIAAYALAVPMPWRRALPWALALALSWPLGLLALAMLSSPFVDEPGLAAQLEDARLRADFQETAIAQLVGAALAVASQHVHWTIRREVLAQQSRHDYRVIATLGRGGMGEVFRAHHPGLDRDVALKILTHVGDAQLESRFVREIRATADLTHPGIVRVHDCGVTDDGRLFYTMELLEGRTLAQLLEARGPLDPRRATYLVRDAARALATAHARGLVHRDIKPENLFVSDVGAQTDVIKVLDFGIAKTLSADTTLTADGMLVGSPRYMALEQALGEQVDARADVYALGGALYFALTGAPPVSESSVFAEVAAHAADLIVPPSQLVPSVPRELDALVMRCLHRDRHARFADAGELARALDATGLPDRHRPERDTGDDPVRARTVDREAVTKVAPRGEVTRG